MLKQDWARRLAYGLAIIAAPAAGLLLEYNLKDDTATWIKIVLIILVGIAMAGFVDRFKDPLAASYLALPSDYSGAFVNCSRWSGELPFDPLAVRSALIACDWVLDSYVAIVLPDGNQLEAERDDKGWRFRAGRHDQGTTKTVVRAGNSITSNGRRSWWQRLTGREGDTFEREEVEQILLAFGSRRPLPPFARWLDPKLIEL